MVQRAAAVVFAPSGHVLTWGWFSIELANLLIILTMIVLFVVALLVPFRWTHADAAAGPHPDPGQRDDGDLEGAGS